MILPKDVKVISSSTITVFVSVIIYKINNNIDKLVHLNASKKHNYLFHIYNDAFKSVNIAKHSLQ